MKRNVLLLMSVLFFLPTACAHGGNTDNVEIGDWKPSEIYTDTGIEAAFKTVKDYFSQEFDGCMLKKLYYPGDTFAEEFSERATQYNADEAIVIYSNFDVDSSGGDGSLNPNSTYEDQQWVLIRDTDGDWKIATNG